MNWHHLVLRTWFHSPLLPPWQKKIITEMRRRVPRTKAGEVVWILSSGTSTVDQVKAVGLSQQSILCSAEAVNRHLGATGKDRWLLALPYHHIGGLAIWARAHLVGAKVFTLAGRWKATAFVDCINKNHISLSSLVPTQIFDLVQFKLAAPGGLRAVIVGGGHLSQELYRRARELGWPLLPSYGLTECASQVATAPVDSVNLTASVLPPLHILEHVEVEIRDQRIFLRSPALCKWIARGDRAGQFQLEDPRHRGGWLATADLGSVSSRQLEIWGRSDDVVKILGVLVPVNEVEAHLTARCADLPGNFCVVALANSRAEHELALITDTSASLREVSGRLAVWNATENIRRIHKLCWIRTVPRSELGKINKKELVSLLSSGARC